MTAKLWLALGAGYGWGAVTPAGGVLLVCGWAALLWAVASAD